MPRKKGKKGKGTRKGKRARKVSKCLKVEVKPEEREEEIPIERLEEFEEI
ncbi:MAG: hypothetical protein QW507_03405 [Candidatus Nanoarchaeia archaeon]|nr:hypothetical protein [Candidatus Haiyanarchaeum thermophilum]MCW1302872.1 hypothetical protein [Candidatus Haiyanarchaeum thermophilum]MCW1303552.1 hypothetical protein [Candidatus Haiyanarchaeum thermophilum]MCW1306234.1 hypothetical protein [Candidatus Haiyanarchaeum thermophilum]MCW1307312.1 hypothetical protein [Candidatus Haiyanarchaeum thermophilum]